MLCPQNWWGDFAGQWAAMRHWSVVILIRILKKNIFKTNFNHISEIDQYYSFPVMRNNDTKLHVNRLGKNLPYSKLTISKQTKVQLHHNIASHSYFRILTLTVTSEYCLSQLHQNIASHSYIRILLLTVTSEYCLLQLHQNFAYHSYIRILPLTVTSEYCLSQLHQNIASHSYIRILPLTHTSEYCLSCLSHIHQNIASHSYIRILPLTHTSEYCLSHIHQNIASHRFILTGQVSRITRESHGCWQFLQAHGRETMLTDMCESHGMLWSGNTNFFRYFYFSPTIFIFHQRSVRRFQDGAILICWISFVPLLSSSTIILEGITQRMIRFTYF